MLNNQSIKIPKYNNKICHLGYGVRLWCLMPLSIYFSYIVAETGVTGENQRPATSHCQPLSHNVVSDYTLSEWDSNFFEKYSYTIQFIPLIKQGALVYFPMLFLR